MCSIWRNSVLCAASDILYVLCSIWRTSVLCFIDFALLRRGDSAQMTIVGHHVCGVQSRVFPKGTEVKSQPSAKDLF